MQKYFPMMLIAIVFAITSFTAYYDALSELLGRIMNEERYSHATLIPLVTFYLIWIKRFELIHKPVHQWLGVVLVVLSVMVVIIGELSAVWTVVQYSLVMALIGVIWSYVGSQNLKVIIIPLLLLLLSIPLPYFIDVIISGDMQLISSQLGVFFIRVFGIPVYLEGNIIDLGRYKLQVVEACSGLNYLYPLMSIGLIIAYVYKGSLLEKSIVFLSTIPITILLNSIRIGMIGVLVDAYGNSAAEGFLHYFEGWVIFIICIFVLLAEVKLFSILKSESKSLSQQFAIESTVNTVATEFNYSKINRQLVVSVVIVLSSTIFINTLDDREDVIPDRKEFVTFPLNLDGWLGNSYGFINNENDILGLDDYLLADYRKSSKSINLYIAYVASQRKGFVPHSPKACIPGGGWEISHASTKRVVISKDQVIDVARMLITHGQNKQLVYYWFNQRGKNMSSEIEMKYNLLADSIKYNRTDGAMIRLVTAVNKNIEDSDVDLESFMKTLYPHLNDFIPDIKESL